MGRFLPCGGGPSGRVCYQVLVYHLSTVDKFAVMYVDSFPALPALAVKYYVSVS